MMIISIGIVIAWFVVLIFVVKFPDDNPSAKSMIVMYFYPMCLVSLLFWSAYVGFLISRWRGDAKAQLLLRITDELQKPDA